MLRCSTVGDTKLPIHPRQTNQRLCYECVCGNVNAEKKTIWPRESSVKRLVDTAHVLPVSSGWCAVRAPPSRFARRSHTHPPGCRVAYIHGTRVRVRRHCPFPEKPSLDPFPRPRFFLSSDSSLPTTPKPPAAEAETLAN